VLKIQAERLRRGWTQVDLGYRARVQPADISRFERGQARPYPKQAVRLARVLKLSIDELLQPAEAVAS